MSPPTSSSSSLAEALYGWPPPVLDPAGPFSHSVTTLSWVLIGLVTLIFIGVCAAMWVALYGSDALRAKLGGERVVKWFGLIIPAAVLLVLLVWGLLMGGVTLLLYGSLPLATVMAVAMLLNMLVAATAGVLCPLVLERMGRDPVMGSSILLTGITDSMGFLIFLGLATAFLL